MNKNKLKDDIKNALTDLKDDYRLYESRYDDFSEKNSPEKYFSGTELEKIGIPKRSYNTENAFRYAMFKMIFPQISGFVIGCAVARFMTLGFIGYMIMGIIFAFLVGVHKSTYNDRISLKYAVIKNIVLMLIEIAVILLFAGIYGIIYLMG